MISDDIDVLSAKDGRVRLDDVIAPDDETLNYKSPMELSAWGNRIASQLSGRLNLLETEFVVLAGQSYYLPLRPHLPTMTLPLIGLPMGKRLAKLDSLISSGAQCDNQNSMCVRLHKLFNGMTRYIGNTICDIGFDNGIYILFEVGETYKGMDRIVRVGTHKSDGRLHRRLKDHFLRENKDGSIFRKNIGKAILNKNNSPYLDVWNVNTSKPENIANLGSRYNPAFQKKVEESVTKYMRENFSFVCFPVETETERLRLEEGIIATLNIAGDFKPSTDWRGRFSPESEIVNSGMWLKQGLGGIALTESEFDHITNRCAGSAFHKYRQEIPVYKPPASETSIRKPFIGSGTRTADIVIFIEDKLRAAEASGAASIRIKSGYIHKELGLVSRMPMVCQAMRKLMKDTDVILYQPPKGNGATLEIEYKL